MYGSEGLYREIFKAVAGWVKIAGWLGSSLFEDACTVLTRLIFRIKMKKMTLASFYDMSCSGVVTICCMWE